MATASCVAETASSLPTSIGELDAEVGQRDREIRLKLSWIVLHQRALDRDRFPDRSKRLRVAGDRAEVHREVVEAHRQLGQELLGLLL